MDAYLQHEIEAPADDELGQLGVESELPEPSARDEAEVLSLLEQRLTRAQRRRVRLAEVRLAEAGPAAETATPGQPREAG